MVSLPRTLRCEEASRPATSRTIWTSGTHAHRAYEDEQDFDDIYYSSLHLLRQRLVPPLAARGRQRGGVSRPTDRDQSMDRPPGKQGRTDRATRAPPASQRDEWPVEIIFL